MKYPGNVDVPIDLVVPESLIDQVGEYGDIVVFSEKDGSAQRCFSQSGVPFAIHPKQKFKLVKPKE